VRPFRLLVALALVAAASGAAPAGAATVIVTTSVGGTAADTMPFKLWHKLVVDALGPRATVTDDEPTIADEASCRAVHADYAVFATFERAPRLPGLAQAPDRVYAIARVTVRNCVTGALLPARFIPLESDPTAEPGRGETRPNPSRQWEHPVRAALGRIPLIATAPPK